MPEMRRPYRRDNGHAVEQKAGAILTTCRHCNEPIFPGEHCRSVAGGSVHRECLIRMCMGSAEHILGECGCYRPAEFAHEEPAGLTPREAARRAARAFDAKAEILHEAATIQ